MKRILFATLLLLSAYSMRAQEAYSRFAEDHKVWKYQLRKYNYEYYTDGDTVIAGRSCIRLYMTNYYTDLSERSAEYVGAIYDEGRKSYVIDVDSTAPRLLYDFEVSAGDTLMLGTTQLRVDKDTTDCVEGKSFRKLWISNLSRPRNEFDEYFPNSSDGCWMEGIGTSPYLIHSAFWSPYYHQRLIACFVGGELIWYDDFFYHPDTDGIKTVADERIEPSHDTPIYDLQGRRIQGNKVTGPQGNGLLPRGVYIQNGRKFVVK